MKEKFGMNSGRERRITLTTIDMALIILFTVSIFVFAGSYENLKASIQDERVDSVNQIAELVSDRVAQLRQSYVNETVQMAKSIENSHAASLEELKSYQINDDKLLLINEQGQYYNLDGIRNVVADTELLESLMKGSGVSSSFATIQNEGDCWLFVSKLNNVEIGGSRYLGVVLSVSAQQYADVATISLYNQLGESLVVARDGTIKMRPSYNTATSPFDGYNILRILENNNVETDETNAFATALDERQAYSFSCTLSGNTWLIQSIPSDGGRNIVVAVPVSITAQSTYKGLAYTLINVAVSIIILAVLFIYNFGSIIRKNQQIEVEHARAKSKSDFLDKMSHDIRTPLNAIVGMHELAIQSLDDRATVYDCLIKAKKSCDYLVSVINDVLDMSRIESGKMTVSHTQFDLQELLENVVQIESSAAAEKEIDLKLITETDITTDFMGDTQRIRQCLINLLNNAVKFTPRGGHVSLRFQAARKEGSLMTAKFSVEDDGIGMSDEFMEKLFVPFEQEQNSMVNAYAGSGLGLSIVHEFVTLMGGIVTATSRKDEGSTFEILLPLEMAEKAEHREEETDDSELQEAIRGRRILLVEDNAINRQIIAMLLTKLGLVVDEAQNGQEAADRFEESEPGQYSLILMDIMMPVMGGLEAAETIRKSGRPDAETVPIIALSANAFEEDARKSLNAGMQMHLAKPVDMKELKIVLRKYIK